MKKVSKKREHERGFATLGVLLMMAVLFMLVATAIKMCHQLHTFNQMEITRLQKHADVTLLCGKHKDAPMANEHR